MTVITNKSDVTALLGQLEPMPFAEKVYFVTPKDFDVSDGINPHMCDAKGNLNIIDKEEARLQWIEVTDAFRNLNLKKIVEIPGVPGLPDMVFCANQALPYLTKSGEKRAVMSNMLDDRRQKEVLHIENALQAQGYGIDKLPERGKNTYFESMGDCFWVPGKRLLLGGYGFRTSKEIYPVLSQIVDAPIITFELKNKRFYHMDTCLSVLDAQHAIACREAFTDEGWQQLQQIFPNLIVSPLAEADAPGFACNACCPDRKNVIIQSGNVNVEKQLKNYGFNPVPVQTSEFIKSGGSVFCMKGMFF